MKKEIGPGTIATVAVVLVLVLSLVAWRHFGSTSKVLAPQEQQQVDQRIQSQYQQYFRGQRGGAPQTGAPQPGAPQPGGR